MNRPHALKMFFAAVSVIMLLGIGVVSFTAVKKMIYPVKYSEYVEKYCEEYSVEIALAYAVIRTESGFDPDALSHADAKGLMQLTDETFMWLQKKSGEDSYLPDEYIYDPETNIKYGIYFLSVLDKKYGGDETLILSAYNAGMGNVGKWLEDKEYSGDGITLDVIPFKETANYVDKVSKSKQQYIKIYNH